MLQMVRSEENTRMNVDVSNIKMGQVWLADLSGAIGSEQGGIRPVLIIQNDIGNKYSPTTIMVPITSKIGKNRLPTHILLKDEKCLTETSLILAEQLRTIDKSRLRRFMGNLSPEAMRSIPKALNINFSNVTLTRCH